MTKVAFCSGYHFIPHFKMNKQEYNLTFLTILCTFLDSFHFAIEIWLGIFGSKKLNKYANAYLDAGIIKAFSAILQISVKKFSDSAPRAGGGGKPVAGAYVIITIIVIVIIINDKSSIPAGHVQVSFLSCTSIKEKQETDYSQGERERQRERG